MALSLKVKCSADVQLSCSVIARISTDAAIRELRPKLQYVVRCVFRVHSLSVVPQLIRVFNYNKR